MCGHRARGQSSFWLGLVAAVVLLGGGCASSEDRGGGDDLPGFVGDRVDVSEPVRLLIAS
jgi:hypothetical protein